MGVYIKGMEIPKDKRITLTLFPDGRVYENRGERLWGNGKDCIPWKAVNVTPHGRLGDLDALEEKAIERARRGVCVNVLEKVITAYDIETAPTVIPAEKEG